MSIRNSKDYFQFTDGLPKNLKETLKSEIRLQYLNPNEVNQNGDDDRIHFQGQNFYFYGYRIKPMNTTFDSEKYTKTVYSEFCGVLVFERGDIFVGEFSKDFKPNGEGILFFVSGCVLKSFFHDGKVHSNTLISYPFDVLIFAKFNKGMISEQLYRINSKDKTYTKVSYIQGKFRNAENEQLFDEKIETMIREAFSINLVPEDISVFKSENRIFFGTFLLEDKSLYYGFAKNGFPIGWGIVVRVENNVITSQKDISDNYLSWYVSFFKDGENVVDRSSIAIDSKKIIQKRNLDSDMTKHIQKPSKYIEVEDGDKPIAKSQPEIDNPLQMTMESDILKHDLKPILTLYRQSKLVFGFGNDECFFNNIGIYYPCENKFLEAKFETSKIYFSPKDEPIEGIQKSFIPEMLKTYARSQKIKRVEDQTVSPIFNMTYFNDAFLFFLFGLLKVRAREFFPDNLHIIQPSFFKVPFDANCSDNGSMSQINLDINSKKAIDFIGMNSEVTKRNSMEPRRFIVDFDKFKSESQLLEKVIRNTDFLAHLKKNKIKNEITSPKVSKIDPPDFSGLRDSSAMMNLHDDSFFQNKLSREKRKKSSEPSFDIEFEERKITFKNDQERYFEHLDFAFQNHNRIINIEAESPKISLVNEKMSGQKTKNEKLNGFDSKIQSGIKSQTHLIKKEIIKKKDVILNKLKKNGINSKGTLQSDFDFGVKKVETLNGKSKNQTSANFLKEKQKQNLPLLNNEVSQNEKLVLSLNKKLALVFEKGELKKMYQTNTYLGNVVKKHNNNNIF